MADEVDAIFWKQHVRTTRHAQLTRPNDRPDKNAFGKCQFRQRFSEHVSVFPETHLRHIDPVARDIDHVERAVRLGDVGDLVREQNVGVEDHIDAEHVVGDATMMLLIWRPVTAFHARHRAFCPESFGADGRQQVHLVVVGDRNHQAGLLAPGTREHSWARSKALKCHHVALLRNPGQRLGVDVNGDNVVSVLLEPPSDVTTDLP